MFFFEKKNQKTFARLVTRPTSAWATYAKGQKFFASFFQKISLPLFCGLPGQTLAQRPMGHAAKPEKPQSGGGQTIWHGGC
jgi:hypothetical protein